MHELYSRYYLQHILWLKGSHHDYYVQPPAVRHHDIADVELKIIKDRERCLLWLDRCLAYEEDVNMLNLRTFLCDHSMHYLPVGRFDDHRVLSETADMLSNNRYAIVVRPKFMTSSTTVEQGAIFAHILGKKPGDVYAWGQGEFTQNAAAYAHPLTPGESAYLAHYNLAPVDPRALTDEQAREAQRLFGDGPDARTQYANWRSRARIINHYKFTHPATVEGLMLYYRVTRDTNPAWFALERGWQLGSGKEMFTGKPVSRTRAGLELLLGLGVIKLFGALAKAGRRAEAPGARPPKPAKGKGMAEVESPGKKAGDVDGGMQKKYIGNREGPKKTFNNLAPGDTLGTPKLLDLKKIKSEKISKKLNYVVTEEGTLVLGARSRLPGGGHIDLARGRPVQAAGEVQFVDGKIKFVNNKSGHYKPSGESAKNAAIEAFGLDDASLYKEIKF